MQGQQPGSTGQQLFPWTVQQTPSATTQAAEQAIMSQQEANTSQQQRVQQPGVFLPPHLRRTVQPQLQQQEQPPAGMSGLMGLLAAHRGQTPAQQQQQQQQPTHAQPQEQLPPHFPPAHLQQQAAAQPQQPAAIQQQQQQTPNWLQQPGGTPAPQAAQQPLPASSSSSTCTVLAAVAAGASAVAAAPMTKVPPPGFMAPPPGFAPIPAGSSSSSTSAVTAYPGASQQLQQLSRGKPGSKNRAPGAALSSALKSGSPVKQPPAAATAGPGGGASTACLSPNLQDLKAGIQAAAPAEPSQVPPAVPQRQQQAQQQQQQVQQVQQQQAQPRRDLQQWQQLLQDEASSSAAEAGAPTHFNKEEGVKWLQGFAPEAHALLDKPFEEYFTYIQDKHGPHVLTCVMFFCLGHHDAFKGANRLCLHNADYPAKVLNQRVSFYRLLFSKPPSSKAAMMASIVAHRPDIATWLSDATLRNLFNEAVSEPDYSAVLAGLLLLPEGWLAPQLLGQESRDPRAWLGRFVDSVMQDRTYADRKSRGLWVKADEVRAAAATRAAAARAAAASGQAAPGTGQRPTVKWSAAMAAAAAAVGSTAAAVAAAGSAAAPADASSARGPAAAGLLQQQQQQQGGDQLVGSPGGSSLAYRLKAQQQQKQQQQQQNCALQQGSASRAVTQAAAAAAGKSGSSAAVSADVIKMALTQLVKDRKDVAQHLHSDLSTRIHAMPPAVALVVVGALSDLPQGWAAKHKKPHVELAAVAARTEAYAHEQHGSSNGRAAAGRSGDENGSGDGGWVAAGRGSGDGVESSSSSSSSNGLMVGTSGKAGVAAAAAGGSTAALLKKLQAQRPDVWRGLQGRHKALIKPLTQEQQKKVLLLLLSVGQETLKQAQDAEGMLWDLIENHIKLLTEAMPQKVAAGLQKLADDHPDVMLHMDEGIISRISSMSQAKAMAAVHALQKTEFSPGWHLKCKNPSAWLMGVVSRALRDM